MSKKKVFKRGEKMGNAVGLIEKGFHYFFCKVDFISNTRFFLGFKR